MFLVILRALVVILPLVDGSCTPAARSCPKGSPAVYCKAAPCDVSQCPRYPGAKCVNNYCGSCNARYYVNNKEVTQFCPSSPPKCPDGNPPVQCYDSPCRDKTCPAYPEATCVDDYCRGCNFLFVYNNTNVTGQCASSPAVCPDGSRPVQCFEQPCNATRCQAFPNATCVDDYCGGCNARFYIDKKEVTYQCCDTPPVNQCPPEDQVRCIVDPCDPRFASCKNVQTAACSSDFCKGCRARWFLPDCKEATSACNSTVTA